LFASSSLSPAEQKYSQFHREALAVVFELKQIHKYIYGNKFTLCSDTQAFKEIFSPQKGTAVVATSRLLGLCGYLYMSMKFSIEQVNKWFM